MIPLLLSVVVIVVVVVALQRAPLRRQRALLSSDLAMRRIPGDRQARYMDIDRSQGEIAAVAAVRADLGTSLSEAKAIVDMLKAGHRFPEA